MTDREKDRFGDKLRDAERAREDQYFAKRDKELLEKMREQRDAEAEAAEPSVGDIRCPRCGCELRAQVLDGVTIDECPGCGGMWLDQGEFGKLAQRENEGWFGRLFRTRRERERP